ncbi:MAG: DNA polymerase III subunit gamma/tau [Hyphomicrobiaceae bacterium]
MQDETVQGETGQSELVHSGPADGSSRPYVVLARKYRPETFEDLIGQDAMVTTLRNAFDTDRIAQGYMLTGVRGVGKTTTARILARALNYTKEGLPDRPTVALAGYGDHCREIVQSRHPDVIEMDAASNTGIDNIREVIESARYKPLVARYKVFIIDEVHMLSKGAFNALLKTLEEPPQHVKFIFATTEVRKVPVTVLSRCQRFDLRRVDVSVLVDHFAKIAGYEDAQADIDALRLIARAAEGSVRDGLSILDQAIAMGAGAVSTETVRAMLGLADRGRIFDLVETLLNGQTAAVLDGYSSLHADGADPLQVLNDLAEAIHITTRAKVAGASALTEALSAEEKRRAEDLAGRLSIPILSRIWQMLLKGIDEAARAPNPLIAVEMVLIRIACTADMPTPDEVIRALGSGGARSVERSPSEATTRSAVTETQLRSQAQALPTNYPDEPRVEAAPAAQDDQIMHLETFDDVLALVGARRDAMLKMHLEEHLSLISFESGKIIFYPLDGAPKSFAGELGEKLTRWTGNRWVAVVGREPGAPPKGQIRREREAAEIAEIKAHPAVSAVLQVFPDAEITGVRSVDDAETTKDDK